MGYALRALVMLAAVMPLFAAQAFRPPWWQTLIAATIGAGLGQVALRATRGRRIAAWSVLVVAASIAALAGAWSLVHAARHDKSSHDAFLVVRADEPAGASLTWDDIRALQTRLPSIALAVPYLRKTAQLIADEQSWNTELVGTTPGYFDFWNVRVVAGDRFDASAGETLNRVVVLGDGVVAQLYGAARSPVGEVVRIQKTPFTVIGVLAHRGMSPQGQDLDNVAIVPIEVFASRIDGKPTFSGAVLIAPASPGNTERVQADVRSLLRDRHRLGPGADDDFVIRVIN